jgi:hypothetical protein
MKLGRKRCACHVARNGRRERGLHRKFHSEWKRLIGRHVYVVKIMQVDSKLLLGFPWHINGTPDNNLESLSILPCVVGRYLRALSVSRLYCIGRKRYIKEIEWCNWMQMYHDRIQGLALLCTATKGSVIWKAMISWAAERMPVYHEGILSLELIRCSAN